MQTGYRLFLSVAAIFSFSYTALADEKSKRPIDGIMDNSFLVEEAYNQEPGVVQHIFNGVYGADKVFGPEDRTLDFSFTQEWPVFSQDHQFSYTVPYGFAWSSGSSSDGLGDILLNYRYQAYLNEDTLTAFSPRFSLVLPTGDASRGFSDDTLGYQWNLPFSTTFYDRWFVHANAGLTFLPDVGPRPSHNVIDYNVGASVIYCLNERFHLMLETIGTWNESDTGTGWDREFSAVVSPGARYAINLESGPQMVLGLATPMGVTGSAADFGVFMYFSFEHEFLSKKE